MDGYDIELRNATKRFGDVVAVDDVSLAVKTGEFVSIIGPSGCGKTTTMRMIAGLDQPDAGDVIIRGQAMQGVPPYERNVALVFQSFALFPHLDALGNVEFGLRMRGVDKKTRRERALRALQTVGHVNLDNRQADDQQNGRNDRRITNHEENLGASAQNGGRAATSTHFTVGSSPKGVKETACRLHADPHKPYSRMRRPFSA